MSNTLTQETIDSFRKLQKGFMKPELHRGCITVDIEEGPMPSEDWIMNHCPVAEAGRIEDELADGWLVRLSAPGYLDCTEWEGPFATEDEAVNAIVDTYGE